MEESQKSFTLLELLIVIAVIAILAAIVLISLDGARDRAWEGRGMQFYQNVKSSLGADLVGEWSFDSGSGADINVVDDSGNGNNGTWNDVDPSPWITKGKVRSAGQFFGDNYVDCGNRPSFNSINSEVTIEAWVKPDHEIITTESIVGKRGSNQAYSLELRPTRSIRFAIYGAQNRELVADNYVYPIDKWSHLVGTYDGSVQRIYVNGVDVKNIPFSDYIKTTSLKLGIGSLRGDSLTFPFNGGFIDEVRIYKRGLTAKEIKSLYAEGLIRHLAENY